MSFLRTFARVNNTLVSMLKWLLISLFCILVFVVLWGVASRYLLGDQASWSEELARLLMVWLALLGAAMVCREDSHLGLDVVVRTWPEEVQKLARLITCLLILAFAGGIMAWGGWQLVSQRFASGQTLPALGISKAWFYMALPVSGVLTSLFMVESFFGMLRSDAFAPEEEVVL